jgi:hypothetical protein
MRDLELDLPLGFRGHGRGFYSVASEALHHSLGANEATRLRQGSGAASDLQGRKEYSLLAIWEQVKQRCSQNADRRGADRTTAVV